MRAVVDTLYSVNAWCKKHVVVTAVVLVAVMLAVPQVYGKSYFMGVMCRICLYALLAGALNIINGYSGMTCLGAAGFFCVGAYSDARRVEFLVYTSRCRPYHCDHRIACRASDA